MTNNLLQIYDFLNTVEQVKKIIRFKGHKFFREYPHQPESYESVADHTWRMTLMLMLIEKELAQPIDLAKALKMALIHDIPEILAGDAPVIGEDGTGNTSHANNKEIAAKRHVSEKEAAQKLFGQLPKTLGKELYGLWLEFEEMKTFEAKVVRAIDKIEGKLQMHNYLNGHMYAQHLEFNLQYGVTSADADPALQQFMAHLLDEIRVNYKEFTGDPSLTY